MKKDPNAPENRADWLPLAEVAALVGVSRQALADRVRRGTLDSMREFPDMGGRLLVRPCDAFKKRTGGRPAGDRTGADRKGAEMQRRTRARMYWRKRLLYQQDRPALLSGISAEMIEQERLKYISEMEETVEVETVETTETHGNPLQV